MAGRKRKADGPEVHDEGAPSVQFSLDAQADMAGFLKELEHKEFVRECCHCGIEIEFETDRCPICGTVLANPEAGIVEFLEDDAGPVDERGSKMDPIIHTHEVVFLHLDVSTGEVDYLRRLHNRRGFDQATVQVPMNGAATKREER